LATLDTRVQREKNWAGAASLKKKAVDRLWTAFLRVYAKVTYILPIFLARLSGRLLARLAYCVLPRRRRIGMSNLDRAYGESLSRKDKAAILRASFENFGITAAEFSRIPDLSTQRGRRYVRVEGVDCIDRSRGSLIVSAHLANWEWMGPSLARLGFDVAGVVQNYRDPNRRELIESVRRAGGVESIPKHRAATTILRALRKGKLVGLAIDQSTRNGACLVEFFGHPCWATAAPAHLALRTGVPIYIAWMKREKDGNYTGTVSGPVEFEKTGDPEADVAAYTQSLQSAIESLIRENPEQWMWTHDRWKLGNEWHKRTELQPLGQDWRGRDSKVSSGL